jgi:hypothetical protein
VSVLLSWNEKLAGGKVMNCTNETEPKIKLRTCLSQGVEIGKQREINVETKVCIHVRICRLIHSDNRLIR